jgi:Cytochrome P450
MLQTSPLLLGCSLVIAGIIHYLYRQYSTSRSKLPYPPGPRPLPLLGNALDLPTSHEYETYRRWGKEFGDVVHVSALGQHIVIINSLKAANELLEQRSAIYSGRPYLPMMHEPDL